MPFSEEYIFSSEHLVLRIYIQLVDETFYLSSI